MKLAAWLHFKVTIKWPSVLVRDLISNCFGGRSYKSKYQQNGEHFGIIKNTLSLASSLPCPQNLLHTLCSSHTHLSTLAPVTPLLLELPPGSCFFLNFLFPICSWEFHPSYTGSHSSKPPCWIFPFFPSFLFGFHPLPSPNNLFLYFVGVQVIYVCALSSTGL